MTSRNEKPIIEVKNLSKQYQIGVDRTYKTLSESVMTGLRHPIRTLRNLRAPKETFWALKDVNFEVERGEVLGIIGRNGAGKSTLLKILSRITHPTEGEIVMRGRVGSLLEVGTGFHPELTGRENIFFNGAILGMKRREIEEKFDEIVKFSGVEKFLDTPVKRYSSGMNVRLAFSVAAHLDPEILLVDEVLAVGDAGFQKKCLGKMGEVASEGRTVLFVSHNMAAITSLCSRAILIENGRIKQDGESTSIVSTYLSNNISQSRSHCLINHPNRTRGYKEHLTFFSINMDNGVACYGEPLVFKVGYDFPHIIYTPQFVIIFYNISGIKAFTLISEYQTNDIPNSLRGKGEITCQIPRLPLMPGTYYVDLMLWQPGQKLDEIKNVTHFQVDWIKRDIGQFKWDSSMGVIYVEADWHLSTSNSTRG
jgi:lipopolysaccharide transport system ATP-binding protein